jgi:hypothetical protein
MIGLGICAWSIWILTKEAKGLIFFFDEWDFLTNRQLTLDGLLRPHNGHLSTVPVLLYLAVRGLFGVDSYVPYQVVGFGTHLAVSLCAMSLIARRSRPLALAVFAVVLLFGTGWQNIMWPFQIGMMGSLLFALLSFVEVARDEPRRRLGMWVALSLLCAGGGVAAALTVSAVLVVRRRWTDVVRLLPVLLLYLAWYLGFGEAQSQPGNLAKAPKYVFQSMVWSVAAVGNHSYNVARVIVLALVFSISWLFFKRGIDERTRLALSLSLFVVLTWMLTGISRAHLAEPQASRYLYVGGIIVVCIITLSISHLSNWLLVAFGILCVPLVIQPNIDQLKRGAGGLRDTSLHVRATLTALDLFDQRPSEDFLFDPSRAPQLSVASYDQLSSEYGRIGFALRELRELPDDYAAGTDLLLALLGASKVVNVDRPGCADVPQTLSGTQLIPGRQSIFLFAHNDIELRIRRFSESSERVTPVLLEGGGWYEVRNVAGNTVQALRFELPLAGVAGCRKSS